MWINLMEIFTNYFHAFKDDACLFAQARKIEITDNADCQKLKNKIDGYGFLHLLYHFSRIVQTAITCSL